MILAIDNHDSFTWNLADLLRRYTEVLVQAWLPVLAQYRFSPAFKEGVPISYITYFPIKINPL